MQSRSNAVPAEPVKAPLHGFCLLVEPEPRLRAFWGNLRELLQPNPPEEWLSLSAGEYWPDALVHRPVAWTRMLQSYLGNLLAVSCIYGLNLLWLNQPHVITEDAPKNTTILNYQVSEYLPDVKPQASRPDPPIRQRGQKADPEHSPQKIVSLHVDHASRRQTIIQPDPRLLHQDAPLPNLVAWTPVPAAPVAARRSATLPMMPVAPAVVAPALPTLQRDASRVVFPAALPEVVPPSNPTAANRAATQLPSLPAPGPVVIAPPQDAIAHDPTRLQLTAQAPPQVAAPSSAAVARSDFGLIGPAGTPQVVSPAQALGRRNLSSIQLSQPGPAVVPPSQPIAAGTGAAQARESGQILALNSRPLPPNGPVSVPVGNRKGEFVAGPEGHAGASAAPETKEGNPSTSNHPAEGGGRANLYVETPPVKIEGNAVVAAPKAPATAGLAPSVDVPASDKIDNQVFGSRRRYFMRLTMPNLNSAMASWTVRFAELNADPNSQSDLSAPEAIRKVDPAYPSNLVRDQIEGVVVLHAIIRSDGSVSDVRVLEGFYEELDENARSALERWRFHPGAKNGIPVDVEAVVRVAFRVRNRSAF